MFGVWGARTAKGQLYTGRNLDYLANSGISTYKVITIHHPTHGPQGLTYAHLTVGYAGLWGALTGMSAQGLTVHEANLESDDISFRGFPWTLRLREVMRRTRTLDEAHALWVATNNTVGFNHGVGSAHDNMFLALETMHTNTAYFGSNDVREQDMTVTINGLEQQIAAPRAQAVYRTNHGYDSYSVAHYMWNNTNSYQDSVSRYLMFPTILDQYEAQNTLIAAPQAVYIV